MVTRLSTLVMRDFSSASPPIAETEIGTDWRFSDRFAAVTTISPGALSLLVLLLCACAKAGLAVAVKIAIALSAVLRRRRSLMVLLPPIVMVPRLGARLFLPWL